MEGPAWGGAYVSLEKQGRISPGAALEPKPACHQFCVWLMPRAGSRGSKQGFTNEGPECLGSHTFPAPRACVQCDSCDTDASPTTMTMQWSVGHSRLSFRVWSHLFAGAAGLPLRWVTSRLGGWFLCFRSVLVTLRGVILNYLSLSIGVRFPRAQCSGHSRDSVWVADIGRGSFYSRRTFLHLPWI